MGPPAMEIRSDHPHHGRLGRASAMKQEINAIVMTACKGVKGA